MFHFYGNNHFSTNNLFDCNWVLQVAYNCLKIKSIFLGNFKPPLGIFHKFNFSFLVNLRHSLEHNEAWKDKEPIWSKTETPLSQICKISFLPCFWDYFTILSTISLRDLCMKIIWPQVDFCYGNIYIAMSFWTKKTNSKKFAHVGFCAPEISR